MKLLNKILVSEQKKLLLLYCVVLKPWFCNIKLKKKLIDKFTDCLNLRTINHVGQDFKIDSEIKIPLTVMKDSFIMRIFL